MSHICFTKMFTKYVVVNQSDLKSDQRCQKRNCTTIAQKRDTMERTPALDHPAGALFDRCDRWPSALASCDAASVRQPLESLEWTMGKPRPERRRQFSKAKATRSSPTLKMSTIWTRLIVSGHSKRWLPLHAYTYVSRYLSIPEEPDLIIPGHNVCGCNLYYNVPVPLPSFLLEHSLLLFMAFSSSKYATINALWGTVHQWHAICLLNPLQQPKTRLLN